MTTKVIAEKHERTAVLVENVSIRTADDGWEEIEFDFLCPNCGKRHWATELGVKPERFTGMFIRLRCGTVRLRMPWRPTPRRDTESIYGVLPSGEYGKKHHLGWR